MTHLFNWKEWLSFVSVFRFQVSSHERNIPTPIEGEGGGDKINLSNSIFLLGTPGIVIQPLEWNCKVTFINKPWALV